MGRETTYDARRQRWVRGPGPSVSTTEDSFPLSRGARSSLEVVSSDLSLSPTVDAQLANREPWRGKRAFDIVGALLFGILASPVWLTIWIGLRVTTGRVFFLQQRVGRHGKLFNCYKFQTMVPDAERVLKELLQTDREAKAEWARDHKLRNDPRVTRVGRLLRKTSLDELPQLWNVIKGDMSLVGPRPIVRGEMIRYGVALSQYLAVKPGLTGLWQVSGRNDTGYQDRVVLDQAYVLSCCFILDLGILLRTFGVVLFRSRGY